MKSFSNRLKELLEDISIENLQKELNLNNSTIIYNWLSDKYMPKLNDLIILANIFKCSIDYLLGRTDDYSEIYAVPSLPFDVQLKKIIKDNKTSQYKIVKDKCVSKGNFHSWFKNKGEPTADLLVRLADYFKISIDTLVGRV